nr:MAG TPA: hypothetical protein [Caudoviricetes sp.]
MGGKLQSFESQWRSVATHCPSSRDAPAHTACWAVWGHLKGDE